MFPPFSKGVGFLGINRFKTSILTQILLDLFLRSFDLLLLRLRLLLLLEMFKRVSSTLQKTQLFPLMRTPKVFTCFAVRGRPFTSGHVCSLISFFPQKSLASLAQETSSAALWLRLH